MGRQTVVVGGPVFRSSRQDDPLPQNNIKTSWYLRNSYRCFNQLWYAYM